MYNQYGIQELSYKLNYGPGLKLIEQNDINDSECVDFSDKKDTTIMIVEKECVMQYGVVGEIPRQYKFKIKDGIPLMIYM